MIEKLLPSTRVNRRDLFPHHHPPSDGLPNGGGGTEPLRRSKYAKISPERESELGRIITEIRTNAQAAATEIIDGLGPMPIQQRQARLKEEWQRIARQDPAFVDARNELAQSHRKLAHAVAYYYRHAHSSPELGKDITQRSLTQIMETAETYDPGKGQFSAIAFISLHRAARNEIDNANIVHVPEYRLQQKTRLAAIEGELAQELQRMPTLAEITVRVNEGRRASEHELKPKTVDLLLHSETREAISVVPEGGLDEISEDSSQEIVHFPVLGEDAVVDPRSVEDTALNRVMSQGLLHGAKLDPRSEYVLLQREGYGHLLGQVAEKVGVTPERIRQITKKALQRLREVSEGRPQRTRSGSERAEQVRELVLQGKTNRQEIADVLGIDVRRVDHTLARVRTQAEVPNMVQKAQQRRDALTAAIKSGEAIDVAAIAQQYDVTQVIVRNDISRIATSLVAPDGGYSSMDLASVEAEWDRLQRESEPNKQEQRALWEKIRELEDSSWREGTAAKIAAAKARIKELRDEPLHRARKAALELVAERSYELTQKAADERASSQKPVEEEQHTLVFGAGASGTEETVENIHQPSTPSVVFVDNSENRLDRDGDSIENDNDHDLTI